MAERILQIPVRDQEAMLLSQSIRELCLGDLSKIPPVIAEYHAQRVVADLNDIVLHSPSRPESVSIEREVLPFHQNPGDVIYDRVPNYRLQNHEITKFEDAKGLNFQIMPVASDSNSPTVVLICYDTKGHKIKEVVRQQRVRVNKLGGLLRVPEYKTVATLFPHQDSGEDENLPENSGRRTIVTAAALGTGAAIAGGAVFVRWLMTHPKDYDQAEEPLEVTQQIKAFTNAMDYGMVDTEALLRFIFGRAVQNTQDFKSYIKYQRKVIAVAANFNDKGKPYVAEMTPNPDFLLNFEWDSDFRLHSSAFFHNGQNFIHAKEKPAGRPDKAFTKVEYDALVTKYQEYGLRLLSEYFKYIPDKLEPINDPSIKPIPSRTIPILRGSVDNPNNYFKEIRYTFWSNDKITAEFY